MGCFEELKAGDIEKMERVMWTDGMKEGERRLEEKDFLRFFENINRMEIKNEFYN